MDGSNAATLLRRKSDASWSFAADSRSGGLDNHRYRAPTRNAERLFARLQVLWRGCYGGACRVADTKPQ